MLIICLIICVSCELAIPLEFLFDVVINNVRHSVWNKASDKEIKQYETLLDSLLLNVAINKSIYSEHRFCENHRNGNDIL